MDQRKKLTNSFRYKYSIGGINRLDSDRIHAIFQFNPIRKSSSNFSLGWILLFPIRFRQRSKYRISGSHQMGFFHIGYRISGRDIEDTRTYRAFISICMQRPKKIMYIYTQSWVV